MKILVAYTSDIHGQYGFLISQSVVDMPVSEINEQNLDQLTDALTRIRKCPSNTAIVILNIILLPIRSMG